MPRTAELFAALDAGDRERVGSLLDAEPALLAARDESQQTLVRRAAARRDGPMLALLAERGAAVDLLTACEFGWDDQVAAALARGEDPTQERAGVPLIDFVCEAGRLAVGRALVEAGAFCDLHTACTLGCIDTARYHLEADGDLLRARRRLLAYEPLHCAAEGGHPDLVALLLELGADPNARCADGRRPLHLAVYGPRLAPVTDGHREVVRRLLDAGADPLATDDSGRDALAWADLSVELHRAHGADDTIAAELRAAVLAHLGR